MKNKTKIFLWSFAALSICIGILYLTIDDPKYDLDPKTIFQPLSETQRSSWNQFVESTTQAVATIQTDNFGNEISNYLAVADVSELIENTTSILDSNIPLSGINKLAKAICERFETLVDEESYSEAESIISKHIEIQQKLRDGARQLITYALAQNNLRRSYEVISRHLNDLPEDIQSNLLRVISEEYEVQIGEILEREYAMSMNTYFSAIKHRLPGLWMPKNTCNQYIRYLRTITEYQNTNQQSESKDYEEDFDEGLPKIRNYIGTQFLTIITIRPSSCFKLSKETNNKRNELRENLQNN